MGSIIVVSSPSGGGKTTVVQELLRAHPNTVRSISYTTRARNSSETDGKDYHYVTGEKFRELIKKDFFIEWAEVHGHYYGTSKKDIQKYHKSNKDVFCVIDVEGGLAVKKLFDDAVLIFLLPPSIQVLKERLIKRNRGETKQEIRKRLKRTAYELAMAKKYDYCVVNDKLYDAVNAVWCIIESEKQREQHKTEVITRFIRSIK